MLLGVWLCMLFIALCFLVLASHCLTFMIAAALLLTFFLVHCIAFASIAHTTLSSKQASFASSQQVLVAQGGVAQQDFSTVTPSDLHRAAPTCCAVP
jgi:hypothetical protein